MKYLKTKGSTGTGPDLGISSGEAGVMERSNKKPVGAVIALITVRD